MKTTRKATRRLGLPLAWGQARRLLPPFPPYTSLFPVRWVGFSRLSQPKRRISSCKNDVTCYYARAGCSSSENRTRADLLPGILRLERAFGLAGSERASKQSKASTCQHGAFCPHLCAASTGSGRRRSPPAFRHQQCARWRCGKVNPMNPKATSVFVGAGRCGVLRHDQLGRFSLPSRPGKRGHQARALGGPAKCCRVCDANSLNESYPELAHRE